MVSYIKDNKVSCLERRQAIVALRSMLDEESSYNKEICRTLIKVVDDDEQDEDVRYHLVRRLLTRLNKEIAIEYCSEHIKLKLMPVDYKIGIDSVCVNTLADDQQSWAVAQAILGACNDIRSEEELKYYVQLLRGCFWGNRQLEIKIVSHFLEHAGGAEKKNLTFIKQALLNNK